MYDESYNNYNNITNLLLKGIQCESELSISFFSKNNINIIQSLIKKNIYDISKGNIILEVDQDLSDLIIVMRSVYFEYGKFIPCNIQKQIYVLNNIVLKNIIPNMITEIKQHQEYIRTINNPIVPIPLPITLNDGTKSLPAFNFFNKIYLFYIILILLI